METLDLTADTTDDAADVTVDSTPDAAEDLPADPDLNDEVPPESDVVPDADTEPDVDAPDAVDEDVVTVRPHLSAAPCSFVFADTTGRGFNQPIQLHNSGTATAEVRAIEIPETAATRFSFVTPELPFEIEPGESRAITLYYEAGYPDGDRTLDWVVHYGNEDTEFEFECSTRQDGPSDSCPLVDVELSVVDDPLGRRGPAIGWASTLDTIRLEARELTDDPIEDLFWRFHSGPPHAERQFIESPDEPDNEFVRNYRLVTPGAYSLCLEVASVDGEFCSQCSSVGADAPDALWAEVFWDVEFGNADLDVHAVRMTGAWFDEDVDAWVGNEGLAWGDETSGLRTADEVRGPETVQIIEECRWFALGVHHTAGESAATPILRVYSSGAFLTEVRGPTLQPGDFWDAARLHWPDGRVLVVDEHLESVIPGEFSPPVTDSMLRSGLCDTE
jgi:hypothetical protein